MTNGISASNLQSEIKIEQPKKTVAPDYDQFSDFSNDTTKLNGSPRVMDYSHPNPVQAPRGPPNIAPMGNFQQCNK